MSSTSLTKYRTSEYWNRTSVKLPWTFQSSGTWSFVGESRTVTDTVKRAFPADPFASGTARTYNSTWKNDPGVDWDTADGLSRHINDSLFGLYIPYENGGAMYKTESYATVVPRPVANSSMRASMYNTARNDARGKGVNLGNALGEYKQTATLFRDAAMAVVTKGKSLLRRYPMKRGFARVTDLKGTVAQNYLAFQYGIRPLYGDISQALTDLKNRAASQPVFITGVVKRRDLATVTGFYGPNTNQISRWAAGTYVSDIRYRTKWRARLNTNTVVSTLSQHGMLNIPSIAWELTPYSFVLDWWFNIGDVIQSLDNSLVFDTLTVLDSLSTRTYEYVQPRPNGKQMMSNRVGAIVHRKDERSAPTNISTVNTLLYKPSISVGHVLNGMALLHLARGRTL